MPPRSLALGAAAALGSVCADATPLSAHTTHPDASAAAGRAGAAVRTTADAYRPQAREHAHEATDNLVAKFSSSKVLPLLPCTQSPQGSLGRDAPGANPACR